MLLDAGVALKAAVLDVRSLCKSKMEIVIAAA